MLRECAVPIESASKLGCVAVPLGSAARPVVLRLWNDAVPLQSAVQRVVLTQL